MWWLTLLNRVVPYLFLPLPIFFVLMLWARQRWLAAALIPPALIFVYLYGPYLYPRVSPQPRPASQLRVLTFNVLYSNDNADRIADIILTHAPDLVALQEVQPQTMQALEERLAADYPFAQLGQPHPYGTTAIFSRHPLIEVEIVDLETDRTAVAAEVQIDNQTVTFISAHLLAYGLQWVALPDIPQAVEQRTADQNRQAQLLLDYAAGRPHPVIIGCDCNSYETASSYRLLNSTFDNASRSTGWHWAAGQAGDFLPDFNLQHIDFVLYGAPLEPLRTVRVRDAAGSDHRPVLVDFRIRESRP